MMKTRTKEIHNGNHRSGRRRTPTGENRKLTDRSRGIDEAQPSRQVKLLRKGRGKLVARVERIVADLAEAGTVKSGGSQS